MQFSVAESDVDNYIWSIQLCPFNPIPQPVILFLYGHDTDYVVAPFIASNKLSLLVRPFWVDSDI